MGGAYGCDAAGHVVQLEHSVENFSLAFHSCSYDPAGNLIRSIFGDGSLFWMNLGNVTGWGEETYTTCSIHTFLR